MNWERTGIRAARRRGERGSALLIVFVFAAMIAIMLYAELPIAVFEAKREKEQLLIDRGNEYAHSVKLFVRKFGTYPTTVEQLENTNRMRFLRHRFKDPFTGKDDWRMLHAGPGGQLIDSKVKPLGLGNAPGNGSEANSSSSFGSSSGTGTGFGSSNTGAGTGFGSASTAGSGFGQSGFGSSSDSANTVVVPSVPQRPPAISASGAPAGGGGGDVTGTASEGEQNVTSAASDLREQIAAAEQGQPNISGDNAGQTTGSGEPAGANANQNGAGAGQNLAGQNPAGQGQFGQSQTGQSGTGQVGANGQNAMETVRNMLNNPALGAPLQGSAGSGATSAMGQIAGGGIAGVASKAKGRTIKVVNDQTDYSLWEFYYDPTKDLTKGMPGVGGATGAAQQGSGMNGNGINPGQSSNSNQQSSFGQSSFGQNSASSNSAGTTAAPTNPPQQ